MRAKALAVVFSEKMRGGKVLFVDTLSLSQPKTKEAKGVMGGLSKVKGFDELSTRRNNAALILTGSKDVNAIKSFHNMGNVMVQEARNANPVEVMRYRFVVIADPEMSVKALSGRMK